MAVVSFDKVKQLAGRWFGIQPKSTPPGQTSGYSRPVTPDMESYDREALRTTRYSTILDVQKMVSTDARCAKGLDKLAADAAIGGYILTPEQAQTEAMEKLYLEVIAETSEVCKIQENTKGWIHTLVQDGDLFSQIEVDEATRKITRMKELAAIITYSHMNTEGNFPADKPAYYQVHPLTRQTIKEFEGWQISHVGWMKKAGHPYGRPLFAPARLAFNRLDSSDKNLVLRRAIGAGYSLHHSLGNEGDPALPEEIEEYKRLNRDTLTKPMNPVRHWFSNNRVAIKELSGDTTLGDMEDLKYFESQLLMITGIPYALWSGGRERDVNRDILKEQEEDYFRVVGNINDIMELTFRRVFAFAMLLAGLNPEAFKYSFTWAAKDRDDIDKKIQRGIQMQQLGYSFKSIHAECAIGDVPFEEEMVRVQEQIKANDVPYGMNARLDPNLVALYTGMAVHQGNGQPEKTEALIQQIQSLQEMAERSVTPEGEFLRVRPEILS